ncbi:MAG: T9SS type A sorting domain-containing protein, partial [Flavobacteriales bacterium]|nr:T9SS type A sorting domain-containing protein [Flavobacteriales bacterium]
IKDASKTSIEVRNALMDAAPRVTDDLLLLTLKRQPALEGWHMAQAMLANSPLRAGVMTELAKTDYYPFYKALVQAGQTGGLNTRQIMEMDYAHYLTSQYRDLDELLQLQFDLEEEGDENWTEVEQQLLQLDYLLSEKDKALMLTAKGDLLAAQNELANCTTEEEDYCDIISTMLSIQINGMSSEGLPSASVAELQSATSFEGHKMKGTAAQLLAFWNLGNYEELLELPEGPGLRAAKIPALEDVEIKNLAVNPNPASEAIYINYLLPDGWEHAQIQVYDNTGKMIEQFNASQFNGIIEMNGKELSAGIYTIELIADKIKIGTTKLTVVH